MQRFLVILVGQFISHLGSHLAGFALGIWLLQKTGSMSIYSLIILANNLPQALLAPLAGAVIDRWGRRPAMLLGLAGACLCSLAMATLHLFGLLGPGLALALIIGTSSFSSLLTPAFESLPSVLVPDEHLNRANGLTQLVYGFAHLIAPVAAGFLLPAIGLAGIFIIDVVTFVVALVILALVFIPQVARPARQSYASASFLREVSEGWHHIRGRRGVIVLLCLAGFIHVSLGMAEVLFTPLVLSFAGSRILGIVHSIGGVGFLCGSILTTTWRGPRRLLHGVLGFFCLQGLVLLIAVAQPSAWLAGMGTFGFLFSFTFIMAYSQTVWQRAIPLELQGRVFAFRLTVTRVCLSVASPLAGLLGDHVAEPLMAEGGLGATMLGSFIGTGPGRGAALLLACIGMASITIALLGFASRSLRALEDMKDREDSGDKEPEPPAG